VCEGNDLLGGRTSTDNYFPVFLFGKKRGILSCLICWKRHLIPGKFLHQEVFSLELEREVLETDNSELKRQQTQHTFFIIESFPFISLDSHDFKDLLSSASQYKTSLTNCKRSSSCFSFLIVIKDVSLLRKMRCLFPRERERGFPEKIGDENTDDEKREVWKKSFRHLESTGYPLNDERYIHVCVLPVNVKWR
jgi:hypothetical protein